MMTIEQRLEALLKGAQDTSEVIKRLKASTKALFDAHLRLQDHLIAANEHLIVSNTEVLRLGKEVKELGLRVKQLEPDEGVS